MAVKIKLTADAYTVGLLYVKPLEMNAMTVILDKKYEPIPLRLVWIYLKSEFVSDLNSSDMFESKK